MNFLFIPSLHSFGAPVQISAWKMREPILIKFNIEKFCEKFSSFLTVI